MNYKLPKRLFDYRIDMVVRYSRLYKSSGMAYWDSERRILSTRNDMTGGCLSMRLPEDSFCLNFLPPASSMLQMRDFMLAELENEEYEPFGSVMRRLFPQGGHGRRYAIADGARTRDAMVAVKDLTRGRASIKSLYPMRGIRFRYVDTLEDRVELRTLERDALLVIPYRTIHMPKRPKSELQDLLYDIEEF